MKKRLIRWAILLVIGFSLGSIVGLFQAKNEVSHAPEISEEIPLSPDDNTGNRSDLIAE